MARYDFAWWAACARVSQMASKPSNGREDSTNKPLVGFSLNFLCFREDQQKL